MDAISIHVDRRGMWGYEVKSLKISIMKGRTVKVGVPKKVVFTKISAHVSVSNKPIS
jgi:hypothetical protein